MFNETNTAFADEEVSMPMSMDKAEKMLGRFTNMSFLEASKLNAADRAELLSEIPLADRAFVNAMIDLCTC